MCMHVPKVQLCIKILFKTKFLWKNTLGVILLCMLGMVENTVDMVVHCECSRINAACLCGMCWNPSD